MELFFEISILFSLVIFQSLFGVGLLLFGTPIFLLLGYNFETTLILILPVSITISLLQLIYHKNPRNYHLLEFNFYCLPFLFIFLMINIYLGELINIKAPEHLQLILKNTQKVISQVKNAGAIFVGPYTPEAVGDYIAGPNHVLPTNGTAKFSSGLGVIDFYKRTTIVKFNKNSLNQLGKYVITLAEAEGLEAHARSISIRIDK